MRGSGFTFSGSSSLESMRRRFEDFHVSRWGFSMITFNDCSTKVYVFEMCRWGLKALRLLAGDNLTHTEREKNSGHTSERSHQKKKDPSQRIPVLSLCTPRIQAVQRGKGAQKPAIGRSTSTGVSWFCMSPGNLRTAPGRFSIPRQPNGPKLPRPTDSW